MSRAPILNHSHWDTIDLGHTDNHNTSENPHGELDPPAYHHIYFPRYHDEKQAIFAEEEEDHHSETASSINADLFPLPPTYSSQRPRPSSGYHTFTPPVSPTTTLPADSGDDWDGSESCYFETLDFDDYMQAYLPHSPLLHQRHHSRHRSRRSRRPRHHQVRVFGGRLRALYAGIATRSLDLDAAATTEKLGLRPEPAWKSGRRWHAARKAVGSLCRALVLVLVLMAVGWAAAILGGGLRTMASGGWEGVESTAGGDGSWGNGSGGLCSEARPRFCRFIKTTNGMGLER
ncbi:hypothetical protein MFIFM68171_09613 [Madurella fahalii]|uniref:Uncharacterized protein n=1 Tax=Madurella fahalii TaxID=1157608 RepID=A0ABQ0GNU1_9PEZI